MSAPTVRAADVRAEHEAAMGSLTQAQRRAVGRELQARNMASFGDATRVQRLERLFALEASIRSGQAVGAPAR